MRHLARFLRVVPLSALLVSGCATIREEEKPLSEVVLMVSRGSDEAVLSWNSRAGDRYTVLYADSRAAGARWQPLPGAQGLRGTGGMMTIRDPIPSGRPRFYRIDATPASGRRP